MVRVRKNKGPAKFTRVPCASIRNMEDEKVEDNLVQEVYTYLIAKRYPDGVSNSKKRVIRKKATKFMIFDSTME